MAEAMRRERGIWRTWIQVPNCKSLVDCAFDSGAANKAVALAMSEDLRHIANGSEEGPNGLNVHLLEAEKLPFYGNCAVECGSCIVTGSFTRPDRS